MYVTYLEMHFKLIHKNIFDTEADLIYYWQPQWTHIGTSPEERKSFYSIGGVNFNHLRESKCVWITRNIYDTLASLYYHSLYRDGINYSGTVSDFVRDSKYGALKICCFYAAMYESLCNGTKRSSTLKISYEQLVKDSSSVLLKLLDYAGIKPNNDYVKVAVEKSEFKNMKKLGTSYAYEGTWLAPTNSDNEDSYKVRKAEPGGFKKVLSKKDIEYIDAVASIVLPNNKEILRWT
jgi:hypothetical protein